MKKRGIALFLALLLVFSISANAAQTRDQRASLSLSFSGTTANCSVYVVEPGVNITAVLSLWNGSTLVDSWSGSGATALVVSGSCPVVKGQTYTLKVTGTINGVLFVGTPVTATC